MGLKSDTDTGTPLCSFGLLADVQYADVKDGQNFRKDRTRHYRSSLTLLERAVTELSNPGNDVGFILQLGDLIDGHCRRSKAPSSQQGLERALSKLHAFSKPVYHVWGNHKLYNFSRAALLESELNTARKMAITTPVKPPVYTNCYDFSPAKGFRIVVLDQYEISLLGCPNNSAEYQAAESIVRAHNKNHDLNNPDGLVGVQKRFVKFNGAISDHQLQWLDCVLQHAERNGERVLVAGHIPIYQAGPEDGQSMCWNYDDIVKTLHKYGCVVAYFSGHDHEGGFATDQCGIHHITLEAIIETAPDDDAFAVVDVHTDRLLLRGYGRVPTRELLYRDILQRETLDIEGDM